MFIKHGWVNKASNFSYKFTFKNHELFKQLAIENSLKQSPSRLIRETSVITAWQCIDIFSHTKHFLDLHTMDGFKNVKTWLLSCAFSTGSILTIIQIISNKI